MWKLLKFLFTGNKHDHAYNQIDKETVRHWENDSSRPYKITHTYTLQCSCGNIKTKTVTIE